MLKREKWTEVARKKKREQTIKVDSFRPYIKNSIKKDPKEIERKMHALRCRYCYYTPNEAEEESTVYQCMKCGSKDTSYSNAIPLLCKVCSLDEGVCIKCGNSLD